MSSEEMELYKNYRGTGTRILAKRKRDDLEDDDDEFELHPAKRLAGDVGVVVGHCELVES
jgi:mRNA (guanine-N7-)-methyltransferase